MAIGYVGGILKCIRVAVFTGCHDAVVQLYSFDATFFTRHDMTVAVGDSPPSMISSPDDFTTVIV